MRIDCLSLLFFLSIILRFSFSAIEVFSSLKATSFSFKINKKKKKVQLYTQKAISNIENDNEIEENKFYFYKAVHLFCKVVRSETKKKNK